ncbi:unnamed protein product, partial [Prorocentrum cordatum]
MGALQKPTWQNAAGTRNVLHLAGEFWLTPLEPDWVQAPMATSREYIRKVSEVGKGRGLGPPRGQVAASFVEEIAQILDTKSDLDAPMHVVKQALKELMVSDEEAEMDTKQRTAKLTRAINASTSFRAVLCCQKLDQTQRDAILGFKGGVFKQALGHALVRLGAVKSRSGGPKTGLERAVETQLSRRGAQGSTPHCPAVRPAQSERAPRGTHSRPRLVEAWPAQAPPVPRQTPAPATRAAHVHGHLQGRPQLEMG